MPFRITCGLMSHISAPISDVRTTVVNHVDRGNRLAAGLDKEAHPEMYMRPSERTVAGLGSVRRKCQAFPLELSVRILGAGAHSTRAKFSSTALSPSLSDIEITDCSRVVRLMG
jgi:hypothetical protein